MISYAPERQLICLSWLLYKEYKAFLENIDFRQLGKRAADSYQSVTGHLTDSYHSVNGRLPVT